MTTATPAQRAAVADAISKARRQGRFVSSDELAEAALTAAAQTTTPAQINADNQRLRSALADMVEITKRNSSPSIILTAIRTCAAHALTVAAHVDNEVSYSENDVKIIIAANIERCAQVADKSLYNEGLVGNIREKIAAALDRLKDEI